MYTDGTKNNFIIESELDYDPTTFHYLYEKYNDKFQMYYSKENKPLGLEVVYDAAILDEPVVKYWANVFRDFGLNFDHDTSMPGSGQAGFQLVRTNLIDSPKGVTPHRDCFRNAGLVFPLTFPQRIQWYENDTLVYDHEYTNITFINAGGHVHGVEYSSEPRWQFQFDIHVDWESIPGLLEKI
jgi:hypothetical protein